MKRSLGTIPEISLVRERLWHALTPSGTVVAGEHKSLLCTSKADARTALHEQRDQGTRSAVCEAGNHVAVGGPLSSNSAMQHAWLFMSCSFHYHESSSWALQLVCASHGLRLTKHMF